MTPAVRILLVDDDFVLRESMARILESAGHIVEHASSDTDALSRILPSPCVVLLNLDSSGIDGVELCRRIRRDARLTGTFVAVTSTRFTPGKEQAEALEAGADGYLAHPFSAPGLTALVDAWTRIARLTGDSRKLAGQLEEQHKTLKEEGRESLDRMEEALAARDRTEHSNRALKDGEAQFRSLVEGATDGIVVLVSSRFAYVNAAACRLLGADSADLLLGQPAMNRFHHRAHGAIQSRLSRVVDDREPAPVVEEVWVRLDGREIAVEVSAVPIDYRGQDAALLFVRDLTERRARDWQQALALQVLATLNRGNDVSRLMEDILQLIKTRMGVEDVAIVMSDEISSPACLGSDTPDSTTPELMECMCQLVVTGQTRPSEACFTRDGSYWTNSTAALMSSPSEQDHQTLTTNGCNRAGFQSVALIPLRAGSSIIGLLRINDHRRGFFTLETIAFLEGLSASIGIAIARRTAADAQKHNEARARALFEASPDAVFVTGPDGRYLEVNPTAMSRYGYTRDEFLRMGPVDLAVPELREDVASHLSVARNSGTAFECRHRCRDGREIPVEIVKSPFFLDGKACVLSVARDITDRKKSEEEHEKLRMELIQAQKMESVGRLAGGVAHDFNNLLTVINGYGDLLLNGMETTGPVRDRIAEIRKAGQTAAELVQQLLTFSRKQVTQTRVLDLNAIVADVEKMLQRVIGEDVQLVNLLDPGLGKIQCDTSQITQVLMNLAVNARDAMPGGGQLLIETANIEFDEHRAQEYVHIEPGRYVSLVVTDSGSGMDHATQAHIFEPFFTTKAAGAGTGLGLSTVYGIVRRAGGVIHVYSEPERGTTFKIYFPRVDTPVFVAEATPPAEMLRGSETILVVEDQAEVRLLAQAVLTSYGYQVIVAGNAGEAVAESEKFPGQIHLLLTDIIMPGMSGRELAERLQPLRPTMKVLYMSGYTEDTIIHRGIIQEEVAYLPKPFSPVGMARKVRELLGPLRSAATVLIVDDEPAIRGLFRLVLEGAGYDVLEAENGRQAVAQLTSAQVELVVTDLAMPDQEGLETIRMLRKRQRQLKIIAVSGAFQGQFLEVAEKMGADAALAKPVGPDQLLKTVGRILAA